MPDVQELSDNDMSVAQRMAQLPDSVLFGEETEDKKAGQERSDDPEAPDEIRDEAPTDEVEAEAETAEKGAASHGDEADPEFEIPDANGGEPRKLKLSELVEAEREYSAFKEEKAQILTRVQTEAMQHAQGMIEQTRQTMTQVGYQLQAVQKVIQPPQPPVPPSPDVTNQYSPNYDPDAVGRFMMARANWEQQMGLYNMVQQSAQGIAQQQQQFEEQRDEREFHRLAPHWPEFTDPVKGQTVQTEFVAGMHKHYGLSPQETDAALTDHRYALVARDALKWREHQASQTAAKTSLKEKVVAARPAARGQTQGQGKTLTSEQSAYMNARKQLKANGKDMSAAAKGMLRFL